MKFKRCAFLILFLPFMLAANDGCDGPQATAPRSDSGVAKATAARVAPGPDGLTVEQRNVTKRLAADNKPGSIKHLYVISAYSGQVLIYSTVQGKVTSSGKRLNPKTVVVADGNAAHRFYGFDAVGNRETAEVLEDDGTYGDSVPYIYWFDARGVYHQHWIEGGQILHVSDQPLAVKSVVLNMELTEAEKTAK
jgi:hypothetical protein